MTLLGLIANIVKHKRKAIRSIRRGKRIVRNEPCPCGSGVKFKKCCGKPE
jgi:uncharacterized protein YecA (UPF0149 family)